MRSCSKIVGIYMISWCSISEKTHSHSSPLSEQGTVRVRFLHSSLHILCFDICIDWQEEKQMTRLNTLHPSLGAWKDSTLCILPLGPEKTQKKTKKPKTCPQYLQSLEIFGFFCFFVFFVFFWFFVYLDHCGLFWHIWACCGLLWPFDDVKTLQEENTAKHCKENSAKRTGAQRPFLFGKYVSWILYPQRIMSTPNKL